MKKGRLLSLILTICMVLSLVPMVAYADEVIINDDPINVKVKDYSVDKSSISVDIFVIFRNKETGEEIHDECEWLSGKNKVADIMHATELDAVPGIEMSKKHQESVEGDDDISSAVFEAEMMSTYF